MNWTKTAQLTGLLGVLLSATVAVTGAEAQSYGRVGAANQQATGTPPGGATRTLSVGANIVVKERIRTSASGSTQIQFPDQSAINLGANCDMVIDEFVYDPQSKSGTMVASATRGALRFIGGQISHNSGVTIRTPAANVGIRGGIVSMVIQIPPGIAQYLPQSLPGNTLVFANNGQITVNTPGGTATLKPDFAVLIGGPNDPIPPPFRLPDVVIELIKQLINGPPGTHGGVANYPTESDVPLAYKFTVVQDPTPGFEPLGYLSIFSAGNGGAKGPAQTGQAGSVSTPPPCNCD